MTSSRSREATFSSAAKKVVAEAPQIADASGRSFMAFMDEALSKQSGESTSKPSFADFGPATQRMLLSDAMRGYLQKLNPVPTTKALSKLIEDFRLKDFRELCLSKPDKLDNLIKGVLTAYLECLMPDVRSMIQNGIKTHLHNLRTSAKLLEDAFSLPLFERLPIGMAFDGDDHFMFGIHLGQALASVEYLDAAFDQHFAIIPDTRKKGDIKGRRVLFSLLVADVFRRELGTSHRKIITELSDVLLKVETKKYNENDAARSAENRWKKRRPVIDESKPVDAAIRVILPEHE